MTTTTIKFYAMDAATAEAELGLVSYSADHKFLIVEFWEEADQYEISGAFGSKEAMLEALEGEKFEWYA